MEDPHPDPDIHFSVTPLYNVKPGDEDFESDMFEFEVEAIFTRLPDYDQDDDDDDDPDSHVLDYDRATCTTGQATFMVERRADDESFSATVSCRLEDLGVPAYLRPYLVNRILQEAKSMERNKDFLGCKVIRVGFSIDILVNNQDEDLNDDDVVDTTMVPASKSSMESLERVNVEGLSSAQCSICLEEISARLEAIRLPCSHVYHSQCIRSWLEKSGNCPLCRFVI